MPRVIEYVTHGRYDARSVGDWRRNGMAYVAHVVHGAERFTRADLEIWSEGTLQSL